MMHAEPGVRSNAGRQRKDTHTVVSYVLIVCCTLALIRFSIAFHEAYAVIRAERASDSDLIELCVSGAARQSAKMRSACLDAQSDGAAPIAMKALIKTISDFVRDTTVLVGWPVKVCFVLCALTLLATPIRSITDLMRGVRTTHPSAAHHTIYVMNGGEHSIDDAVDEQPRRFDRIRRRMGSTRNSPTLQLPWNNEEDEETQCKAKYL